MEEEKKDTLNMAAPERMRKLAGHRCFGYALTHDVNKAIHIITKLTTDYSEEDEQKYFVEPVDMLEKFTLIYYKLLNDFDEEIAALVKSFVAIYPTLITAQAMALGDMFKRDDYPTPNEILTKFSFRVNYMPVPTSGDIRVDVGNQAQAELKAKLEALTQERIDNAMADIRARLGEHLKRMSDRLTTDYVAGEAKQRRFHDSLVEGALDLCDMTKALNVTNDLALEDARRQLEQLLVGVTPDELRKNEVIRQDVKKNVDAILSKFDF